jgi:rhodanese-related sulfurtransferase
MKHSPGFLRLCEDALTRVREIQPDALLARIAEGTPVVLVDVREDREWEAGHIPGAVHVGRGVLERDAEALWPDPSTMIVLYCGGGYRSALAADAMQRLGFTEVVSLAGGVRTWQAAGLSWST